MKALISSKTAWFGILQIVFGIVGIAFGFLDQQTGFALIVTGFSTIGLRIGTSKPIGGIVSVK